MFKFLSGLGTDFKVVGMWKIKYNFTKKIAMIK